MSEKDDIWSYLTKKEINEEEDIKDWYSICELHNRPTSFTSYLHIASMFSSQINFILIGKVIDYRKKHPELRKWRSGFLCFYGLNFRNEVKNVDLLLTLHRILDIPISKTMRRQTIKYSCKKKDALEDMDRYFNQYNNHVTIKGISMIILHNYDFAYVQSFFRKLNMDWTDSQYEKWEHIRPDNLESEDEDEDEQWWR
jgi:hypothetical protein